MTDKTTPLRDKTYLGDSVYAGHDGFQIWLWTNNGFGPWNMIALEPEVFEALVKYRDTMMAGLKP